MYRALDVPDDFPLAAGTATTAPVISSGTGLAHPVVGELHAGRIGESAPAPITQAASIVEPQRLRAPIQREPLFNLPPGEPIAPYKPAEVTTPDYVAPTGGLPDLGVIPRAETAVTQPQVGAINRGIEQPLSAPVQTTQAPAPAVTSAAPAGEQLNTACLSLKGTLLASNLRPSDAGQALVVGLVSAAAVTSSSGQGRLAPWCAPVLDRIRMVPCSLSH